MCVCVNVLFVGTKLFMIYTGTVRIYILHRYKQIFYFRLIKWCSFVPELRMILGMRQWRAWVGPGNGAATCLGGTREWASNMLGWDPGMGQWRAFIQDCWCSLYVPT